MPWTKPESAEVRRGTHGWEPLEELLVENDPDVTAPDFGPGCIYTLPDI